MFGVTKKVKNVLKMCQKRPQKFPKQIQKSLENWPRNQVLSSSKAYQIVATLTQILAMTPGLRRRPERLAASLREALAVAWDGAAPSVLCSHSCGALAPGHGFVVLRVDPLDVVVVLPP